MIDAVEVSLESSEIVAEGTPTMPQTGTRTLMMAVLEDALMNLGSPLRGNRAEAEGWIMSRERRHVFSFAVICETLDLAPSAVRRSAMRLLNAKPRVGRTARRARQNVRHTEIIQLRSPRQKAA